MNSEDYDMSFTVNSIRNVSFSSSVPIPNPVKSDAEIPNDSGPSIEPLNTHKDNAHYMDISAVLTVQFLLGIQFSWNLMVEFQG